MQNSIKLLLRFLVKKEYFLTPDSEYWSKNYRNKKLHKYKTEKL